MISLRTEKGRHIAGPFSLRQSLKELCKRFATPLFFSRT